MENTPDKNKLHQLYYKMLNIRQNNDGIPTNDLDHIIMRNKAEIKQNSTSVDGLCKVMSHNISIELRNKNIEHRIINTKDILGGYEHLFIIAYFGDYEHLKYALIDPTYEQFISKENMVLYGSFEEWPANVLEKTERGKELLTNLISKGWTEINNMQLKTYLGSFMNEIDVNNINISIDELILNPDIEPNKHR